MSSKSETPGAENEPGAGNPPGRRHAWEHTGSIFDRVKSPVSSRGEVQDNVNARGVAQSTGGAGTDERTTEQVAAGGADASRAVHTVSAVRAQTPEYVPEPGTLPPPSDVPPPDPEAEKFAERQVAFWFLLSALSTIAFIAVYVQPWFDNIRRQREYNALLGVTAAVAVGSIGFGLVLWAKKLLPEEEAVQEREPFYAPEDERLAAIESFNTGFEETQVARRPLLRRSLLLAGGLLALVPIVPLRSLVKYGPKKQLFVTHWTKDAYVVDKDNNRIKNGDLAIGGILTVYPEGDHAPNDSTVLLIRLEPGLYQAKNPDRADWAPYDHVAFSKICTHAGCPVALYQQQTHHLLCPCHQSVFDVVDHAKAIFGPAARPLPQLPLYIDSEGYFRARSDFHEPIGPSFWERG
jgi:ubiquinol-cytochrome c reductase iron-sulfur subunit